MSEKIIIIGGGPAGYTAGIYAARGNLAPLVFEGFMAGGIPGGQLMTTGAVENFPGFEKGIDGQQLMATMRQQALNMGCRILTEDIEKIMLDKNPFEVLGAESGLYQSQTLVVATGAAAKRLPLPSERKLWGKGLSACAVCDGALPMFRNKPLAVIGGGDSAIEEALHLSHFGSKVYLIHRRDSFRASHIMRARAQEHPKIEILWNKTVEEFLGESAVSGLRLRDTVSGALTTLEVAGAFEAIGHRPNTALVKGQLELDEDGYVITKAGSTETSRHGVFAAGDVQDKKFRQAITSAASGCMAAIEAGRFLQETP
ncbi:MAG: thioredoxin-disulfide reductase [Chitinivibrionales bacterium]|nr:thioredoxin-disulfide reductase [Chitinivibrionales bacterium]